MRDRAFSDGEKNPKTLAGRKRTIFRLQRPNSAPTSSGRFQKLPMRMKQYTVQLNGITMGSNDKSMKKENKNKRYKITLHF